MRLSAWTLSGRGVALPTTSTAPRLLRAVGGDAARVVARVALVLVGRLVLLVDDHEAELRERREDGRARADGDPRLAAAQAQPLVVALALAELRVQHRDRVAEARLEARDRLRRERDLGHEHEHRLPAARAASAACR